MRTDAEPPSCLLVAAQDARATQRLLARRGSQSSSLASRAFPLSRAGSGRASLELPFATAALARGRSRPLWGGVGAASPALGASPSASTTLLAAPALAAPLDGAAPTAALLAGGAAELAPGSNDSLGGALTVKTARRGAAVGAASPATTGSSPLSSLAAGHSPARSSPFLAATHVHGQAPVAIGLAAAASRRLHRGSSGAGDIFDIREEEHQEQQEAGGGMGGPAAAAMVLLPCLGLPAAGVPPPSGEERPPSPAWLSARRRRSVGFASDGGSLLGRGSGRAGVLKPAGTGLGGASRGGVSSPRGARRAAASGSGLPASPRALASLGRSSNTFLLSSASLPSSPRQTLGPASAMGAVPAQQVGVGTAGAASAQQAAEPDAEALAFLRAMLPMLGSPACELGAARKLCDHLALLAQEALAQGAPPARDAQQEQQERRGVDGAEPRMAVLLEAGARLRAMVEIEERLLGGEGGAAAERRGRLLRPAFGRALELMQVRGVALLSCCGRLARRLLKTRAPLPCSCLHLECDVHRVLVMMVVLTGVDGPGAGRRGGGRGARGGRGAGAGGRAAASAAVRSRRARHAVQPTLAGEHLVSGRRRGWSP